jgi:hypothetical protein
VPLHPVDDGAPHPEPIFRHLVRIEPRPAVADEEFDAFVVGLEKDVDLARA